MSSEPPSDAQILSRSTAEVHSESLGNDTIVSHEPVQGSCLAADIGNIFVRAKSSEEFCSAVHGLTITLKYKLLKNHRKPGSNLVFPIQYLGRCNRSFLAGRQKEHPWMVYSELVDGAFCIACKIFSAHPLRRKFVIQHFLGQEG